MKKVLFFLSCIFLISAFWACDDSDDDSIPSLIVETNDLKMPLWENDTIQILRGAGGYTVTQKDEEIATVKIVAENGGVYIVVSSKKEGTTQFEVADKDNGRQLIKVEVKDYHVGEVVKVYVEFAGEITEEEEKEITEEVLPKGLAFEGSRYWFQADGKVRIYQQGKDKGYIEGTYTIEGESIPEMTQLVIKYEKETYIYECIASAASVIWGDLMGYNFIIREEIKREEETSFKVYRTQDVVIWQKTEYPEQ